MSENVENPGNDVPERLAKAVVREKPDGEIFSDQAAGVIAKLGSELLLSLSFRDPKDPEDKVTKNGLGVAEVLQSLGQEALISEVATIAKEEGYK